ncbi:MAG: DUF1743 domain-containing protein [Candidatus Lokiarchaeota archaeon]|nr:DUF1743 domain-containing protein [Candidatus Lokiarchaeota archaeon]
MKTQVLHIGFDDIDNPEGGCTTHFASIMIDKMNELGVEWMDFPNLIRLNPNIPFRTRGNGAIAFRIMTDSEPKELLKMFMKEALSYARTDYQNTNPGIAIVPDPIPGLLHQIARDALWRFVPTTYINRILHGYDWQIMKVGSGRGLIGALAAIGNTLLGDHTYELVTYRSLDDAKESRDVNTESVIAMDEKFSKLTFANIDYDTGQILIEPHGPDPVLFGLRGENPDVLKEASNYIVAKQSVRRWTIFRTNQGTGVHLQNQLLIKDLRPYQAATVKCTVRESPKIIEGGHLIFSVFDDTGSIECAVYEPTGGFRDIIKKLIPNDIVLLHAGVRPASRTHDRTLNIEGIEIVKLATKRSYSNPLCPKCGKRLKSAGRNKGYKCTKCGFKSSELEKIQTLEERTLAPKLYLPPPRAQRHLTRPYSRINHDNSDREIPLASEWHSNQLKEEK